MRGELLLLVVVRENLYGSHSVVFLENSDVSQQHARGNESGSTIVVEDGRAFVNK